jgi:hypothetical protein
MARSATHGTLCAHAGLAAPSLFRVDPLAWHGMAWHGMAWEEAAAGQVQCARYLVLRAAAMRVVRQCIQPVHTTHVRGYRSAWVSHDVYEGEIKLSTSTHASGKMRRRPKRMWPRKALVDKWQA